MIRKFITTYFKQRDCITFVRPVEEESQLQRLDTLDESLIRLEFREQVKRAREKIFKSITAKMIAGQKISSAGFLSAAEVYINTVNSGKVLTIQSTWVSVRQDQNASVLRESISKLEKEIVKLKSEGSVPPNWRSHVENEVLKHFKINSYGSDDEKKTERERLEHVIKEKLDSFEKDLKYQVEKELAKATDSIIFNIR